MNLYHLKQIKNRLDRRLIDLFVVQNQQNDWLTLKECASWVFETNTPSAYQRCYTENKLTSLVGAMGTVHRRESAFDMKHKPSEAGGFIYRLKSKECILSTKSAGLQEQINSIFTAEPGQPADCAQNYCLEELDF